ncbi:MAG: SUN domain-containing protein, partial [Congregibacter sp.]|nr:SUN domain-containing protein [Congregibacter sp.]
MLTKPIAARFAKIRMARFFDDAPVPGGGKLGELKIIATPGEDVSRGLGYNLADPALGGHVVWSLPPLYAQSWDDSVLVRTQDSDPVTVRAGKALDWVIGFHHDRAARLARLDWSAAPKARAGTLPIDEVEIFVSKESPVGPWQSLGLWRPEADGVSTFTFPSDAWARFVRFRVAASDSSRSYRLPAVIDAWEIPASPDYFSILGEWGADGRAASYELARGPVMPVKRAARTNLSRDAAAALVDSEAAAGEVEIGRDDHWYAYTFTDEHNSVLLGLSGDSTVQASLEVHGTDDTKLNVQRRRELDTPNEIFWEATGEPGQTALIRVYEPPRNVLFLWDTSASVGAYIPVIYSALGSYARGLVPGRDAANLMPFGGGLLLDDWYGDPYVLETVLNDYPRRESSSAAESTVAAAARVLATRQGSKSIVLITDAATGRYPPVWEELQAVRPRVFALGLSSEGAFGRNPPREQDLQQDWASVNGGRYDQVMD